MPDSRLSREWKTGGPAVLHHLEGELGQQAPSSTEVDARGEPLASRELLDAQSQALQQNLSVCGQQVRHLTVLVCGEQAFRVAELARLGLFVAQSERQREASCESAAAQVEHSRTFATGITDERDIRCASAHVDEDPAFCPRLLAGTGSRERIGLRDRGRQL